MLLKNDYLIANFNDVIVRSYKLDSAPYYTFDPTAIEGWTDGVSAKRQEVARANGWGDFEERTLKNSRLTIFTGMAVARDAKELQSMRDDLFGVFDTEEYIPITVSNSSGSRTTYANIASSSKWVQVTDQFANWKIELYSPDPRLYGVEKVIQIQDGSEPGGIKYSLSYPIDYGNAPDIQPSFVANTGNTTAWPKFKVYGQLPSGFTIDNGLGQKITYKNAVTNSAPVLINTLDGTATQNNMDKSQFLSERNWWGIRPKSTMKPIFKPDQGTGWCDIIVSDTWI